MLTETGTLPVGVEYNGKTHKDFEIREQLVSDTIAVFDDTARAARATKNPQYCALCITCRQIVRLGDIPADKITPELLMTMLNDDYRAISAAEVRMAVKRETFCSEGKGESEKSADAS